MVPLSAGDLQVTADGSGARVQRNQLAVIDEPKFPKTGPVSSAVEDFAITWKAAGATQTVTDPAKYFEIVGRPAVVEASFTVSTPQGFSFRGHATTTTYAFLGNEANGHYFGGGSPPEGGGTGSAAVPAGGAATGVGGTSGGRDSELLIGGAVAAVGAVAAAGAYAGQRHPGH